MNSSFLGAMKHYVQAKPDLSHSEVWEQDSLVCLPLPGLTLCCCLVCQAVCRLYRASLRCLASWAVDRGVFNKEATRIQGLFRTNVNCSSGTAKRLMREAEEQLFALTHPVESFETSTWTTRNSLCLANLFCCVQDKYIPAYLPGGSLFMRNPPLPLSVCYPDGLPEGIEHDFRGGELNVDMTQLYPGEKAAGGRVLVDSANKNLL